MKIFCLKFCLLLQDLTEFRVNKFGLSNRIFNLT